jgi:HAMP domain-containing protein
MTVLLRLPLQRRIMVLVATGLGGALLAAGLIGRSVIARSTERVLQERLILAQVVARTLDLELAQAELTLKDLAASPDVGGGAVGSGGTWVGPRRSRFFSGGFLLLDATGRVVWPARFRGTVVADPAVEQALGGRTAVTGLIRLPPRNAPFLLMLTPLRRSDPGGAALLGGAVDLRDDALLSLIRPLAYGRTGHAVIVDRNGLIVAGTDPRELFTRGDHPDFFTAHLRTGTAAVGHTPEIVDGKPHGIHVMAFAPLAGGALGLGFGQADWEVFENERLLVRGILLLTVALVTVGISAAWRDAGVIAAPLRRLTEAAQRIASGDLETPIGPEPGYEVGTLARALETMRESLQRLRNELQDRAEMLARREREARALYEASRSIIEQRELPEILGAIAGAARSLSGATVAAICLWDEQARLVPAVRDGPDGSFRAGGVGPGCGRTLAHGWGPGQDCPFIAPALRQMHVTARLRAGDQEVGYMCVASERPRAFREEDAASLSALASLAAVAIQSARLRDQARLVAALEERERIAHDLHDSVIQSLYGVSLVLEHCVEAVSPISPEVSVRLNALIDTITQVIQEVRSFVMGMRPVQDDESVSAALERIVQEIPREHPAARGIRSGKRHRRGVGAAAAPAADSPGGPIQCGPPCGGDAGAREDCAAWGVSLCSACAMMGVGLNGQGRRAEPGWGCGRWQSGRGD